MRNLKILNCRLNKTLVLKLDQIKGDTGLDSDAECVRYLINIYDLIVRNPLQGDSKQEDLDVRLELAIKKLENDIPKLIEQKFLGKVPSLKEQRKMLIK